MSKRVLSAALVTAATLFAAGCGGTTAAPPQEQTTKPSPSSSSAPTFNRADVEFARGMIPHHEQAVKMADMVAGHTDNPELLDLAERIRAAQQPEIDKLTGWLREWNATPDDKHTSMSGMSGMMSHEDMAALRKAHGSAFDEMWLRMMIEHHKGAVDMARAELDNGRHGGARKLATEIIEAQQAEIAEMTAMLRG